MKVGTREVVQTGTIVTHHGADVVELNYLNLSYRLKFITGKVGDGQPLCATAIEGLRLDFTLTNFDSPLGIGWGDQVGMLDNGFSLFLSFFVHSVGERDKSIRSIAYTFSVEKV